MRSVWKDEKRIGYCQHGNKEPKPVTLRVHISEAEAEAVKAVVEQECGPVSRVTMPLSRAAIDALARAERQGKITRKII